MNIWGIKKQANEVYKYYRKMIIPEFFFIGYMSLLAQYLHSGLFSFFVSLFLCPMAHGYVVCSIKLVDYQKNIDYHDSLIGLTHFTRVSPTYFIRKALTLGITLIVALPSLYSIHEYIPEISLEWFASLGNAFIQTDFFIPNFYDISKILDQSLLMANICLCIVVYLLLTAIFMPMPYIMELDDFSWSECLQTSLWLMKGKIIAFFKLYLLFVFRHVSYWILVGTGLLMIGIHNEVLMLLWMVASLFIYIDLYKGRFEIAKYLFYKELVLNQKI